MAATKKFANPRLHLSTKEETARRRLLGQLDKALSNFFPSRKQTARILSELRPLYSKPGCKGRWTAFLLSKKIAVSTANDLVRRHKSGWADSAKKPRKANPPRSGELPKSHVDLTGKPFPDGKEIVEAVFVLTPHEKQQFMESLKIVEPAEAARIMFEALIRHVELMREGKIETVKIPMETPKRKRRAFIDDEPEPDFTLVEQMEREAPKKS